MSASARQMAQAREIVETFKKSGGYTGHRPAADRLESEIAAALDATDEATINRWLDDLGRQMRAVGVEPRKDENEIYTVTKALIAERAALAAETERCARIAEESEPKTWPPGIDTGHMWRRAQADKIAAALRL